MNQLIVYIDLQALLRFIIISIAIGLVTFVIDIIFIITK